MPDSSPAALGPGRAILLGGITVGVLDALDAFVFFGLRGVPPIRILQGIASGLLGQTAFKGGIATATLGTVVHFCIATTIVSIYVLASRRVPALARHPLRYGPLYGIVAWAVMMYIVLPLSAVTIHPRPLPVIVNGLLIHAFGVGLPSALFARAVGAASGAAAPPHRARPATA